ncbi:hypothetical protein [Paraburkholderia sp. BL10I2N1]|uniref:hypothetical protein n=1 Tax=Paraburkholderia sp. BL10I2N1 TaxID=1938796 RepID=UPI0014152655|nr:hypothetical protein [Paraburkholderia sp. BL10I2N1]
MIRIATSAVREVKRARANHVFAQFYFSVDAWKLLFEPRRHCRRTQRVEPLQ